MGVFLRGMSLVSFSIINILSLKNVHFQESFTTANCSPPLIEKAASLFKIG